MLILHNATIVTAEKEAVGTISVDGGVIRDVMFEDSADYDFRVSKLLEDNPEAEVTELDGKWLMAGGIDAHVHFREPGLTHKADMETESRAAAAGGAAGGGRAGCPYLSRLKEGDHAGENPELCAL